MTDPPTSSAAPQPYAIVLYDGECHFCSGWVRFLLPRDREAKFRFAALQSEVGQRLLRAHGLPQDWTDSLVVVQGHEARTRSAGVLAILRELPWPWPLTYACVAIPRFVRDWAYDLIARNRHRLYRSEACLTPQPEYQARFLDHTAADP